MFRQEDIDAYAAMCADPEVMRFLGGKTLSRHDAWRSMAGVCGHWELRGYGMWAVVEKSSGEMIGRVGCLNPEGWRLRSWRRYAANSGVAYATEAARASMDWAFRQLQVPHIISLITLNVRSSRRGETPGRTVEGKTRVLTMTFRSTASTATSAFHALIYEARRNRWRRSDSPRIVSKIFGNE
jgi:hypothetical protein